MQRSYESIRARWLGSGLPGLVAILAFFAWNFVSQAPLSTNLAPTGEAGGAIRAVGFTPAAQGDARFENPAIIEFTGSIDWNNATFFQNRVQRAKARGVDLLVVRIDSPGGLVSQSVKMAETLRDIDWAYTVAYVPDEAISGAALVSFGCDEIVMGPDAVIGDVGAIQYDPELFAFRYVPAKAQSVLVRQARSLAESKGRSPEVAEAMIDKDVLLFRRSGNGPLEYRTARLQSADQSWRDAAKDAGLDLEQWELVEESGKERFLTVDGKRAVQLGIASSNVESRDELLEQLNADPSVVTYRYTLTDSIVNLLNNPIVTGLLVVIGIIALYIELSAPGIGGGGLIAILCAALFFWSRFMGGTSGMLELLLFVGGIAFLLTEIFVIPGWGISGFLGLIMILVSAVMAGLDFVFPESPRQWDLLITNVLVILCSGVAALIGLSFVAKRLGSIPIFNRIILEPRRESHAELPAGTKAEGKKSERDKPGYVAHPAVSEGDWGVAESVLRPAGVARFGRHRCDVVSEGAYIDAGEQIKVREIRGNQIVVEPVEDLEATTG